MTPILKIRCKCGAVLRVQAIPNIEQRSIPCPVCKQVYPFAAYERVASAEASAGGQPTSADATDHTLLASAPHRGLGRLVVRGATPIALRVGPNIVGRAAQSSRSTVQLSVADRTMHREQVRIEVRRLATGAFEHTLAVLPNKHQTLLNGHPLAEGDVMILRHGDVIRMGQTDVVFTCSAPATSTPPADAADDDGGTIYGKE